MRQLGQCGLKISDESTLHRHLACQYGRSYHADLNDSLTVPVAPPAPGPATCPDTPARLHVGDLGADGPA
jgi:hypothetical protein